MRIGLIGCGHLGLAIGYFLKIYNRLYGIYDVDKKRLRHAIKILKIKNNPDYLQLIKNCSILFFATPDDKILESFNQAKKIFTGKKFVFHFSGLLPAEIFPEDKDIYRGALHPFAAFPDMNIPPPRKKYTLFFQGDIQNFHIARQIFKQKHFEIRFLKAKQKPLYHLLGVFSSNLVLALIEAIMYLAKRLKWKKNDFDNLVFPMITEAIINVKKYGIKKGLTGPVVRGDIKTIKKHLTVLKRTPELYDIYCVLSRIIIKYAPKKIQKELKRALNLD